MTYEHSQVETDGGVMTVTFNRPERRNALGSAASHELGRIFDQFEADPRLRVGIVTGSGEQAFCAGADLRSEVTPGLPPVPETGFAGLIARFGRRKPLVAAVNGAAMGGGFLLAACGMIASTFSIVALLLSPPVFGLIYDLTGDYDAIFIAFAGLTLAILAAAVPLLRLHPREGG